MTRKLFTLAIVVCLLGAGWSSVHAQQTPTVKFFSESGHNVKGEFLMFYNSNSGATFIYGYPITEEFKTKDGTLVQYFQRARFEFRHGAVMLTSLGSETYTATSEPLKVNNSFACRTYSETGFSVCLAFLEFFDQHGGAAQFGYPISGFEYHENKLVQYFEKARLEWQPWKIEGQRVVVSDLGRIYFDKLGEAPALLQQVQPLDNTIQAVTRLQVRAFVLKAVTLAADSQQVFIIVQDQALRPLANANCIASIHWANGHTDSNIISTNANGVGLAAFSFTNQPQGSLINIDVACTVSDQSENTKTSFRIWY